MLEYELQAHYTVPSARRCICLVQQSWEVGDADGG